MKPGKFFIKFDVFFRCAEKDWSDILTTDHAIELLDIHLNDLSKKPFYLAVGYHKPHLPWVAEQKFFDMYPLENITLPKHKTAPKGMPGIAFSNCDSPDPWTPLNDTQIRLARRGYYAAVSGMD